LYKTLWLFLAPTIYHSLYTSQHLQHPVLFEEREYKTRAFQSHMGMQGRGERTQGARAEDTSSSGGGGGGRAGGWAKGRINEFHIVSDWEPEMENPAEDKYRKIMHQQIRGLVDPSLKPNTDEREAIDRIIRDPSDNLENSAKDLLWKFRFSLTTNRRAVVKFVLCVDWDMQEEVEQATSLLDQWTNSSDLIDIADALKLLSKRKEFQNNVVRAFAVERLERASEEELELYLLQVMNERIRLAARPTYTQRTPNVHPTCTQRTPTVT
jgi:hypothetical protein